MPREKKDGISSWIYLCFTVFTTSFIIAPISTVGILIVVFVEYYGESYSKAGWIGSTMFFLSFCSYPLVVFLRRHFGFRLIILCTSLVLVFTFVSTPLMPSMNFVFLTFSIPFGFCSGSIECLSIITQREYFDKLLGLATGIKFASSGSISMLYNYLLPIFFDTIGWKKTFFAMSSLGAVCLVYGFVYENLNFTKEPPEPSGKCEYSVEDQDTALVVKYPKTKPSYSFVHNRHFWFILIGSVLYALVFLSPPMFIIPYAISLGYSLNTSKWLLVVCSLASLFGRLAAGHIGDIARRRKRLAYIQQIVIMFFGIASGCCSLTQSLPQMIMWMAFLGFFDGIFWVNLPLLAVEVTSGEQADEAYGFIMLVAAFGALGGPPLTGWILDVYGDFRYVLYIVATCSITGALIMGIGTFLTTQKNDPHKKDTADCLKANKLNSYFGIKTILPDEKILIVVEYETAV